MSNIITTANFRRRVLPILDRSFDDHTAKGPEEWKSWYDVEDGAAAAFEEESGLTGFGLPTELGEGEAITYDIAKDGFVTRFLWSEFGSGFKITKRMIEDGQGESLTTKLSKMLGVSFREARELIHAYLLNSAFTRVRPDFDKKPIIATDHPMAGFGMGGQVWSNRLPDAQFSEAALEDADIFISKATDQRGLKISLKAKDIVIPSELKYDAVRILRSNGQVNTPNNTANALKIEGTYGTDAKVLRYLTSSTAWFIMTDADRGFIHKTRNALERGMHGDFETGNTAYKATERYGVNIGDVHKVYGSVGA
ncbi:hypothetical protein [Aureimonas sp. AU40]|uniref:hypothetical protein n=1 Tax=Aureimonas sp. AU40 TaxID=1637747 RepID=UPI000782CDC2|nr:hypothetical protein [Aureimonas sp. AU40]